jgi:hypothetical protein
MDTDMDTADERARQILDAAVDVATEHGRV